MCLELSKPNQLPKEAKKDIIVYKHLYWNPIANEFWTPYQKRDVRIDGTLLHSDLRIRSWEPTEVDLGFHSFTTRKECLADAAQEGTHAIARCIIPAGSKYHTGTFFHKTSIASNQIIYDKIVLSRSHRGNEFKPHKNK